MAAAAPARFDRAFRKIALLAAGLLLWTPMAARCDTETWNPDGAGYGDGSWDETSPNWDSGMVWTDSNDAMFTGNGGTIAVAGPTVDSLTFSASAPYLLESGTLIFTGGNVTVNSDAAISSTIMAENGLYTMGSGALTLTGSVNMDSASLTVDLGTVNISGGGNVTDSIGYISDNAGAGTVTVSGPGTTWINTDYLFVGETGPGTLQITNGGAVSVPGGYYDYTYIAANPGSTGAVTVSGSGSTWTNSGYISVGTSGTGTVTITDGGAVSNDHDTYIGDGYGGVGVATVSGSGSSWTLGGVLDVGNQGTGTLLIANGASVSGSYIGVIGEQPGSTGAVTVSGTGSTLSLASGLYVGGDLSYGPGSTGLLVITDGASVSAPQTTVQAGSTLALGQNPTLESPLDVAGGALSLVAGGLHSVTLTEPAEIDGGSTLSFDIGNGADQLDFSGAGSLTVTGSGSVNLYGLSGLVTPGAYVLIGAATSGSLSLGNVYNSGNFTYSLLSTATGEEVVVSSAATPLTTAYWQGGQNNVWSILVGGTSTNWTKDAGGASDPGLTPSATTDVIFAGSSPANDGNTELGADMTIKSLTVVDPNAVTISGENPNPWLPSNTLTISGSSGATGITIESGAGPVTLGANLYLGGSSQTVTVNNAGGLVLSGSLGGSNGLTKSGTGTLTIAGAGDFGGDTAVNAGVLIVSGSLTGAEEVDVAGGTLGGAGSIAGAFSVEAGGVLAPGAALTGSAGAMLTIGNNVTLGDGSQLVINIDAASNATDLLNITNGGNLTLTGDDTLTINLVNGTQLTQPGYVIAILSGGGSIDGEFAGLNIPAGYRMDYGAATPGELQLVAIPEPGAGATLLGALAIMVISLHSPRALVCGRRLKTCGSRRSMATIRRPQNGVRKGESRYSSVGRAADL